MPADLLNVPADTAAAAGAAVIREILAVPALSPPEVVRRLVTLANEAGGPDSIALALADVSAGAGAGGASAG